MSIFVNYVLPVLVGAILGWIIPDYNVPDWLIGPLEVILCALLLLGYAFLHSFAGLFESAILGYITFEAVMTVLTSLALINVHKRRKAGAIVVAFLAITIVLVYVVSRYVLVALPVVSIVAALYSTSINRRGR